MSSENIRDWRVLITGAAGFLGSHLCARLLAQGATVFATSRSPHQSDEPRLTWLQSDMSDAAQAAELMRSLRLDIIYHLAGQVTASPEAELVLPTFHSLLTSTVNVLSAAAKFPCRRIVLTGSLTEPDSADGEPIPSSPYAAAKWSASAYARMFHKLYGAPAVIVRPYMTFGPRQHETKLVPHVIRSLLNRDVPRLSSGGWAADWVYIDDVIDGFIAAAACDGIEGQTIDLGTGQMTTIREIVARLVLQINPEIEPSFGALADRPDERARRADVQSAERTLGWRARTTLDEGLANTVRWYREQAAALHQGEIA